MSIVATGNAAAERPASARTASALEPLPALVEIGPCLRVVLGRAFPEDAVNVAFRPNTVLSPRILRCHRAAAPLRLIRSRVSVQPRSLSSRQCPIGLDLLWNLGPTG